MRLRRSAGVVSLSWGLIDQVLSSATNFALAVVAGRLAGPGGLGVVYVGFSAYLVILTMQRALVTDPLIVVSAPQSPSDRAAADRSALTVVISAATLSTAVLLLFGLLLPASVGQGLLFFVPWLVGALVQDFWRVILFRDRRGAAAAMNDGVWAVVMAVSISLLLVAPNRWIVVLTWGLGALAGGALGFLQTGLRPGTLATSALWWKNHAWPLARWMGPESALSVVQTQVVVFALVAILGTTDVGGLRAVLAVFSPISLLAQAISFPGLPMLRTLAVTSRRLARIWALRLSAMGVALVLAYLTILLILPRHLIGAVFGSAFDPFDSLIAPVGVAQLLLAGSLGLSLLLKAEGRLRALLLSRLIPASATVVLAVALAFAGGITAATWGMAAAIAIGSTSIALIAFWPKGQPIGAFRRPRG
jgi:O-antigen/teichoic acid export membrane protein